MMDISRLKAAIAAGADVAFMESPRTMDEAARLVKALAPHPVMINVLPNGLTGNYTTTDCKNLGFKLAIYPCTGFIPAAIAMKKSYKALKEKGTDLDNCEGWQIKDFFEVSVRLVAETWRALRVFGPLLNLSNQVIQPEHLNATRTSYQTYREKHAFRRGKCSYHHILIYGHELTHCIRLKLLLLLQLRTLSNTNQRQVW